jgi:hypothetical protein
VAQQISRNQRLLHIPQRSYSAWGWHFSCHLYCKHGNVVLLPRPCGPSHQHFEALRLQNCEPPAIAYIQEWQATGCAGPGYAHA